MRHHKAKRVKGSTLKDIKTGSSARLFKIMQKLDKSGRERNPIRQAILTELRKRDNGIGGSYGNWEHG